MGVFINSQNSTTLIYLYQNCHKQITVNVCY